MPSHFPMLVLVLVLVSLLIGGCGSVRYAYNQLDWIVPWSVRDYVRFNGDQQSLLEARLGERIAWHCSSELPAYAAFLRRVDRDLAVEHVEVATLEAHADQVEAFVRTLMEALAPDVAAILAMLEDEQVEGLKESFSRRDDEAREKFVDAPASELHDRRVERMEKRLRRWFGRMDADQRTLIEAWSRSLEPVAEDWLARRTAWQDRLIEALEARSDRSAFDARIRDLMLDADSGQSSDYGSRVMRNRERTFELLASIHRSASSTQRNRLSREIDSLVSQFDVLACSDPGPRRASDPAEVDAQVPARHSGYSPTSPSSGPGRSSHAIAMPQSATQAVPS